MATRTPLGTAKTKADGTTLTLADVSASAGDCLVALVGFQQQSMPTVKWGQRDLNRSVAVVDTVTGFGGAIFIARSLKYTDTRDLVVTWPTAIGARVMAATKLDAGLIRDKSGDTPIRATSLQDSTTDPSVGPTLAPSVDDGFAFGLLVSEGPDSDTAPTLSGSWTAGQRDGTVGAPPVSNVTILEAYQQLSTKDTVSLSGTGATSRDWASLVVVFRPIKRVALDAHGAEIEVGDTFVYQGEEKVVDQIFHELPARFIITVAGQLVGYECYDITVVGEAD